MAQKMMVKIMTMCDDKTKKKAIEAVADGVDSIEAELGEQKLTIVLGDMDTIELAKKLKKIRKIDIVSVGPAKEENNEG